MTRLFSPGNGARTKRRFLSPLLAGLSLIAFAGSCASADPPKIEPFSPAFAERVMGVGFNQVNNRYIDAVSLRRFALDGLKGIGRIEPALDVRESGGAIEILVKGESVRRFTLAEETTPQGWADFVAAAIEAARGKSKPLAAADAEAVFQAVFDAGLANLDPFSRYAGVVEADDARASRDGFGGIGVTLRMETADAVIVSVVGTGPAAAAGVQAEDRITHVDGQPISGWQQRDLIRAIRGPVGASVALTLTRAVQQAPVLASVKREHITLQTVTAEQRGNVLIAKVSSFNQDTAAALGRAISAAKSEHGHLKGVVLDLRGNPGGLLDQAVQVSDIFLERGQISETRGRHTQSRQRFEAGARDLTDGAPLVVLVNGGSASASEVVAAALQDQGRAVLVGTNSYGKGTVQTVVRLPNNGEMTLTWSRLLAPSGYILHGLGVLPNVCTHGAGQVAEVPQILSEIRGGQAGAAAVLPSWRAMTLPEGTQVAQLRLACKSDNRAPEIDLAVAEALFADPQLYHNALAISAPTLAGR